MFNFKKIGLIGLVTVFLLVSSFLVVCGAENPVTLRFSTHHPAGAYRSVSARLFKEEIEKATGGKIKIDIYYSQSLAKGREVLSNVESGVVDIGLINPAYYPKKLSVHAGMILFTKAPPKYNQKKDIMDRLYKKYPKLKEEIEKYNQRILWQNFPTPLNLSSRVPVNSIKDFKGLKIRASSEAYLRMLKNLGAIPISVPFTDCYMALQTGTIDAVFTNIAAESPQRFYEPAPYSFTSQKMSIWLPFTYTINKDRWESFSPKIKEQINEAIAKVNERFASLYDEEYENEVKLFRDKGKALVMASDEDVEIWKNLDIIGELKKELVKKAENIGIENGSQFVDDIERFMEEASE